MLNAEPSREFDAVLGQMHECTFETVVVIVDHPQGRPGRPGHHPSQAPPHFRHPLHPQWHRHQDGAGIAWALRHSDDGAVPPLGHADEADRRREAERTTGTAS